jgi:hypothetical protein
VREGGYKNRQKSFGRKLFYRFYDPEDETFPAMLELFSRIPDALDFEGEGHLTPIPMGEEASSLSAILLDEGYYHFLHSGKRERDGLSIVGPEHIIPLKSRAWLDLTERRSQGVRIDDKDIRKHKNDVFRLFRIVSPDTSVNVPEQVGVDLKRFFDAMAEEGIDLKAFGYRGAKLDDVLSDLRKFYGVND